MSPLQINARMMLLPVLLAGLAAVGCSRDADRTRTTESASMVRPDPTPPDSTVTTQDSTPATPTDSKAVRRPAASTQAADTPAPSTPVAPTKAGQATLPRPSIDPGRKPAKSTSPRSAAPAASTTGADSSRDSTSGANPSAAATQSQWLKYDAASNTVTFELIGGPHGFQFNGYASGGATLALPPKANVIINFVNKDGTPHSAEVISGEGAVPNAAVDAAIPRAYTNQLLQGLPQEGTDVMRFPVPESGSYRIICGVPGHALSGMWIWMKVDPAAKAPTFGPTKS
jgi:Sulfocyanin (SoxE) domain